MKTALSIFLLLMAAPARSDDKQLGRFQMVAGAYEGSLSTGTPKSGTFKIDTATGESWYLFELLKDGQRMIVWIPIREMTIREPKESPPK